MVALALVATMAAACGSDGGGARKAVTLVLDWTPNTNHSGFYLAKERGYYRDAGLDVSIIEPGENGGLPQLASGNAQFAVSVAESLLPAREQGAQVVSVGAILAHNTSSLVIPADRGVHSAKDLEGKTYGGYGGELEKALLDTLVTCDGGDPSKVKDVEVGNVDYSVGFARGDYDAVWVFDGWDVIRLREVMGVEVTTIPFYGSVGKAACLPDWYTPLLATSQQLIDDDPELVRSFMAATAKGFEQARTDPAAAAAALLAGAPELDQKLVSLSSEYLASRYGDAGKPWGVQDAATWAGFADFLKQHKLLADDVDPAKAFTNDFLPGADGRASSEG